MNNRVRESVLGNFRPARGLRDRVYRCGTTDDLATVLEDNGDELSESERIFLYDITLNVDLRSKKEVDFGKSSIWTSLAPGGSFQVVKSIENLNERNALPTRTVVHCDLISNVFRYIDTEWLSDLDPDELQDPGAAMKHRMTAVKDNGGLSGLFQVIVESNHEKLDSILKVITVNLENNGKVIVNCTQGKDRTGLLTMLLQSAAGVVEKDIVADFAESHGFDRSRQGSAAMQAVAERFKIDTSVLSGAPPEVMEATLAFLDTKYGSVCPGFLNEIGFDEAWRCRLVAALDTVKKIPN